MFLFNLFQLHTGGLSELGEELKVCECYNPVSDTWLRLPDMHHRRAHVGVAAVGDSLYAVGEKRLTTVDGIPLK